MHPRATISNGIITVVILFFMLMLGMLLKARYRLASEDKITQVKDAPVPKAIPVAMAVEMKVHEARAYKQGDWWVLPSPKLVVSRANEADTLRIRSGPKEDVFVLYFVDAAESTFSHPKRLRDQSSFFQKAPEDRLVTSGSEALNWVTELLTKHPFTVFTRWGRVPDRERFYAFIRVEIAPGKFADLGEMLVRRGYASPVGQQTKPLPETLPTAEQYVAELGRALTLAQRERAGAWTFAPQ